VRSPADLRAGRSLRHAVAADSSDLARRPPNIMLHARTMFTMSGERRPAVAPRHVRDAEQLMRDASGLASVHEIAGTLGISVRSLEAGFRQWKGEAPVAFMRGLRLTAAREQLSAPNTTSVTAVALSLGFFHLPRFSQYYHAAFGEYPSETLRRSRIGRRMEY
jgi:transcriptional regulator GlxA family with amidase domain